MKRVLCMVVFALLQLTGCHGESTIDADAAIVLSDDAAIAVADSGALDASSVDSASFDANSDASMKGGVDAAIDANVSTECKMLNGYCTVQNTTCAMGYHIDSSTSCGAVHSLVCCLPN